MVRVGDDIAGFTVDFDAATNTVHVKAWGYWNVQVALAFPGIVREACAKRLEPTLLMDMTELKPMREEGQQAFGALLESLSSLGVVRTTVTTSSHLTRLQLLRVSSDAGKRELVLFT